MRDCRPASGVRPEKELHEGIPRIKVITKPDAGFFHLIDFSALRNRTYPSPQGGWQKPLEDNYSLIGLLDTHQNISSCTAAWMGMKDNELMTRATFAAPLEDILEYARRLRNAVNMISKKPCCTASGPAPAL